MSIFTRIKAAFSPNAYLGAMAQVLRGYGQNGAKLRPFNPFKALEAFTGWTYSAAMFNAGAVASVPLRLYARKRSGQKLFKTREVPYYVRRHFDGLGATMPSRHVMTKSAEFASDIEEVIEPHPALELLKTVNPWENGYDLTTLRVLDQQITGNAYVHVITDRVLGIPRELWRMLPQYTEVIPDKDVFIKGYSYGDNGADKKVFPADEVDHFKMPNPKNPLYGMGWVEAAWGWIGLDAAKLISDTAVFDNFARPDWLLSVKNGSNDKILDRITKTIEEKFRGADKSGQFMVAGGDVTATPLQWQIPEVGTPTRVIDAISACSGVPQAMLLSNDPTRAGSVSARLGWLRNTIQPYCKRDEEKLNERHLARYPDAENMFLAYDPVAFEDREQQQKRLVSFVAGGIFTPNEARHEEGYSPHEEGDELVRPSGAGPSAGVSAGAGNMRPGQNTDRHNEDAEADKE